MFLLLLGLSLCECCWIISSVCTLVMTCALSARADWELEVCYCAQSAAGNISLVSSKVGLQVSIWLVYIFFLKKTEREGGHFMIQRACVDSHC